MNFLSEAAYFFIQPLGEPALKRCDIPLDQPSTCDVSSFE